MGQKNKTDAELTAEMNTINESIISCTTYLKILGVMMFLTSFIAIVLVITDRELSMVYPPLILIFVCAYLWVNMISKKKKARLINIKQEIESRVI